MLKKIKLGNFAIGLIILMIAVSSGCIFNNSKTKIDTKPTTEVKEVSDSDTEINVTLKYFWSAYCTTCKEEEPILKEFLKEHPTLNFIRIDTEKRESLAEMKKYGIIGAPAFVIIKGEVEKIANGLLQKKDLVAFICPKLKDELCWTQLGEVATKKVENNNPDRDNVDEISKKVMNDTLAENDTPAKEELITENSSEINTSQKPYGNDIRYFSYNPVITWQSLPESREISYIENDDKVIFKFLYSPSCLICKKAMIQVPKIKNEFGDRIIAEQINLYKESEEKWYKAAKEYGPRTRWFPYVLAIGKKSLSNGKIKLNLIQYTDNYKGASTVNQWRKNICNQFGDNKPENCL